MKLIVGLGNPGKKYESTRHNLGFMVVDELVVGSKYQVSWEENIKLKSQVAKTDDLILAKPSTYMNNSGLSVKLLTTYYKIPTTDLLVIHDDLDLPFGKIRISWGSRGAGHLGVESIIKSLGTQEFARVRIGIGHPQPPIRPEDYVTIPFGEEEQKNLGEVISRAVDAVQSYLDK